MERVVFDEITERECHRLRAFLMEKRMKCLQELVW
jgi:hypothetical protein